MAESYITRRGSATGGAGSLNIYYGDSPPSDKVGVFCQTTNPVSNIYVEADPMVTGENTWVIQNSPVSNKTSNPEGWAYHDGTLFLLYSDKSFYRYDKTSQTYSVCQSIIDSDLNGYWIYEYDNLIIKSGGYSDGKMASYCQAYSVDSDIWTQEYAKFPFSYSVKMCKGGYGKNGNSYGAMIGSPSYKFRVFAYNLQTETTTYMYYYDHPRDWNTYCNFSALFGDEYYIKGYSASGSGRAFSAIKINCDTNYLSNWLVGVNPQQIDKNWWVNINDGMGVNGENYIIANSYVYKMNDDMLTYSSVFDTGTNNPPFSKPIMYNTLGTYSYGTYNANLFCMFGQDTNNYETNSIIVVSGGQNNKAELISGNSPVEINVMTSYYWDGTSLTELPTQVRTSDTAWIAI